MQRLHIVVANIAVAAVLSGSAGIAHAAAADSGPLPQIEGIHTQPEGQTYGRWAAEWWQWALGIPVDVNPLIDATGAHCAQRASPFFNVQLPPANLFGANEEVIPELVLHRLAAVLMPISARTTPFRRPR